MKTKKVQTMEFKMISAEEMEVLQAQIKRLSELIESQENIPEFCKLEQLEHYLGWPRLSTIRMWIHKDKYTKKLNWWGKVRGRVLINIKKFNEWTEESFQESREGI